MAINLSDNIFSNSPKPVEGRYVTLNGIPFTSSAHATGSLSPSVRFQGLTVLVSSSTEIAEYWWKEGTTDSDLILKTATAGIFLTTASNVNNGNVLTISKSNGDGYTITIDTGSGTTYNQGPGITIDGNDNISASIGEGLRFDGNSKIEATVRQVNGASPDAITGNVATSLTAVYTGTSQSLIDSSSGAITASLPNGAVWAISGDSTVPSPNGLGYIYKSASVGQWYPLATLNQSQADNRYVQLIYGATNVQYITSSLAITGSSVTFSSSLYWTSGSSAVSPPGSVTTSSVVVLGNDNKLYITGSYGGGGGGTNVKAGSVSSASFAGNPKTYALSFNSNMSDTNYGISVIGGDARTWTIDNKTISGFTINTNSSVALNYDVSWIASPANNPS